MDSTAPLSQAQPYRRTTSNDRHREGYSAARCLADAGASPHEIMAITGHRTLGMVEKYTKQANKTRLAGSALTKLTLWRSRTRTEQESG